MVYYWVIKIIYYFLILTYLFSITGHIEMLNSWRRPGKHVDSSSAYHVGSEFKVLLCKPDMKRDMLATSVNPLRQLERIWQPYRKEECKNGFNIAECYHQVVRSRNSFLKMAQQILKSHFYSQMLGNVSVNVSSLLFSHPGCVRTIKKNGNTVLITKSGKPVSFPFNILLTPNNFKSYVFIWANKSVH